MANWFRTWSAAALLVAAMAFGAQAQTAGAGGATASPSEIGPIVLPNASGTIVYQGSSGTTVTRGGTTVFHGTGATATITVIGSGPGGRGGLAAAR